MVRLQADHVNRTLVPAFYRFLQAQDTEIQINAGKEFHAAIEALVVLFERAEREVLGGGGVSGEGERKALSKGLGLWVEGGDLGWTDVMVGPCKLSLSLSSCQNADFFFVFVIVMGKRDVSSAACLEALQRV